MEAVLQAVIESIPAPAHCNRSESFRALLFDSWYDRYRGVVCLVALVDGALKVGDCVTSKMTDKSYEIKHIGILRPNEIPVPSL